MKRWKQHFTLLYLANLRKCPVKASKYVFMKREIALYKLFHHIVITAAAYKIYTLIRCSELDHCDLK